MTRDITNELSTLVTEQPIVLFMKGTPALPQCGFSATVAGILDRVGADFIGVDVLADPEIRSGLKEFTGWPTFPQLYVKGEFVGGCDIVREMYETGELQALLTEKGAIAAE